MSSTRALCLLILMVIANQVFASDMGNPLENQTENDIEYVTVKHAVSAISKSQPDHSIGTFLELEGLPAFLSAPVEVPFNKERPFIALALRWEAIVTKPHQLAFSVRGSEDGIRWTEWMVVQEDHHAPTDRKSVV